jgi:ketosteroid isomerase-like protein
MNFKAFGALFIYVAIASSGHAQSSAKQVDRAIRSLDAKWTAGSKRLNVDEWVSYYSPNAVLLPPNEPIADTPAKIKKVMSAFFALPSLVLTSGTDKVRVARSLDIAYCYGHYKMTFKNADGANVTDSGKYVEVWRKQMNGAWKCEIDMFNSNLAMGG